MMNSAFLASSNAPDQKDEPAWWFVFRAHQMLVFTDNVPPRIPLLFSMDELGIPVFSEDYLGTLRGAHCYTAFVPETTQPPPNMHFESLRHLYGLLDQDLFGVAMRALGIINWESTHQFCGQCGAKSERLSNILARQCHKCGSTMFPRISPAIIVLVERDNKVLLARASKFQEEMYSVIAGFVEPGESLEETVMREIKEEIGINVRNIRYFGSQPWPFPDSLMVAFTAEYAGGEITVDGEEILQAAWFEAQQLPRIPGKMSIARSLIDWFLAKHEETGPSESPT